MVKESVMKPKKTCKTDKISALIQESDQLGVKINKIVSSGKDEDLVNLSKLKSRYSFLDLKIALLWE